MINSIIVIHKKFCIFANQINMTKLYKPTNTNEADDKI